MVSQENTGSSWDRRCERKGMEKGRLTVARPRALDKEAFPIIPLQPIIRSTILTIKSHVQAPEHQGFILLKPNSFTIPTA